MKIVHISAECYPAAKAGGFQIPKEEVEGLSQGDYLLPYVDAFMSDGAIHGLYQKFDLNKLLSAQEAVTFSGRVTFADPDMAGQTTIASGSAQVNVRFTTLYSQPPIITYNLVLPSETDRTFISEGQAIVLANVTTEGFSLLLDSLASRDFTYNWVAISAPESGVIN